jgi:hypothetical protein
MAFPISPTNSQVSVQNGISYTYASGTNSWTRNQSIQPTLSMTVDTFTGNGIIISFSLSATPTSKELIAVNIDGVLQQASAYSLLNNVITFTGTPITGAIIEVKTINAPPTSILTGLVYDSFTGNGTTTAYTLSTTPTNRNFTLVTVGGVVQQKSTYTVASTTLTFSTAPLATSPIEIITFGPAISSILASGSDTQIQFNTSNVLTASSNLTFNTTTNTFATGNISAATINATGNVTAPFFIGNGSQLTNVPTAVTVTGAAQTNITSVGTLTGLTVTGATTLQLASDIISSLASATGVVVHDLLTSGVFYHTSVVSNFTANFTNVPTTNNRVLTVSLIISQGATPYIPNAVQIDGVSWTLKWLTGSAPSGNASKLDILSFSLIRSNNTWVVTGGLNTFG